MELPGFEPAGQPDIVQASRRDSGAISMIQKELQAAAAVLLGNRAASAIAGNVSLSAGLLYYGVHALRRKPTLGEEYCDLVQVTDDGTRPEVGRGVLLMVLHVIAPWVASKLSSRMQRRIASSDHWVARLASSCMGTLSALLKFWIRAHLAVFYFAGEFYQPARRFARIRYQHSKQVGPVRPPYTLLGLLLAIQLFGNAVATGWELLGATKTTLVQLKTSVTKKANKQDPSQAEYHDEIEPPSQRSCTLCLEGMTATTATGCGHLFCWDCVSEWCAEKPECPLCRQELDPKNFLRVYHYG